MSHSPKPSAPNPHPIDPGVSIGHVHLKVADLSRAIAFYCGVLGFDLMQHYGDEAAFLSAGGYHHHIALNTWEAKTSRRLDWAQRDSTLLFAPTRVALADALRRLIDAGITIEGQATTGLAKPFTCVTLTRTVSNCLGIGPKLNGPSRRTAIWKWRRAPSTRERY